MKFLITLTLILGLYTSYSTAYLSCSSIPVIPATYIQSLNHLTGIWIKISDNANPSKAVPCVIGNYSAYEPGVIRVDESHFVNGKIDSTVIGVGYLSSPGNLVLKLQNSATRNVNPFGASYDGVPLNNDNVIMGSTYEYWTILGTDFNNYALLFGCIDGSPNVEVLLRNPHPSKRVLREIARLEEINKISPAWVQRNCLINKSALTPSGSGLFF